MTLFTVGPVEMHKETLEVAGRQVPYFRNESFSQVYLECEALFKEFVGATEDDGFILLTSSGTGAMEALVINCFNQGDKALVIDGGSFGHRFAQLCEMHHVEYQALTLEYGQTLTADLLEPFNNAGFTHLLVNMDETSTGQLYDIAMLSRFCQNNGMFFLVDAVAAFAADAIHMSELRIDALITGSQKGLSLAPGIALVVISTRLYQARVEGRAPTSMYFDFNDYLENGKRGQTPFTPAVGIVYELQERLRAIRDAGGIQACIDHTKQLASDFRARVQELGIRIPEFPLSNAVTPILFDDVSAKTVQRRLEDEYDFVLNPCGGSLADTALRVSHMGALTLDDNAALIDALGQVLASERATKA